MIEPSSEMFSIPLPVCEKHSKPQSLYDPIGLILYCPACDTQITDHTTTEDYCMSRVKDWTESLKSLELVKTRTAEHSATIGSIIVDLVDKHAHNGL